MYAINFYETPEDKINKPLTTHKGVCENYAAVFTDICSKAGIKSFFVGGYTIQNRNIPHAWCAAFIDTAWFMFDPTWGSGYVENKIFHAQINNSYFKVNPATFIKTHMPFDFLWQFLYYPVTNREFDEGKTGQNTSKPFFNFKDSIAAYEHQNHTEQLMAEANRIERNGVKNSIIYDRLQHIKMEIESDKIQTENNRQSKIVSFFNTAVIDYNLAVNYLNAFIDYRNHKFIPEKPDADIQGMIDTVNAKLIEAKTNLKQVVHPDAKAEKMVNQLAKAIVDLDVRVKEQQDWLNIYFTKSKAKRKSMFYDKKITWLGLPVN